MASLFNPKMPKVKDPTPMADEKALDAARRRRQVSARQTSGQTSTQLSRSGQRETLGG